ncbi:MAG: patatin-like phospholipase family protein, partial [Synergistales bacterium]|nr:patatin-like phospholipase family protein [Synergistales bacterium]
MRRIPCIILIASIIMLSSISASGQGVVLALSGGGAKGLAHIGVLEALENNHIPIAGIVGTSIGAIIGGLYSSGLTSSEIREVVHDTDLTTLLTHRSERIVIAAGREQFTAKGLPWLALNDKGEVVGPLGTFSGVELLERFSQLTSKVEVVNFTDLCIPFAAVATDLETGEKVVITSGSLASAMRASMAVPAVFEPWPLDGKMLVDGGLVSNLPVTTAKELFPGYPVIAVNVTSPLIPRDRIRSILDVVDQSISIMTMQNIEREMIEADLVITPKVENVGLLDLKDVDALIQAGKEAIVEMMSLVTNLASQSEPISCPKGPKERIVKAVQVKGVDPILQNEIEQEFSVWVGQYLDTPGIVEKIRFLKKREDIIAVDYNLLDEDDGTVIVLVLQKKPTYEFDLGGYATNLHSYSWLGFSVGRRDLFSYGDSLDSDFMIGKHWGFDLKYYLSPYRDNRWEFVLSGQSLNLEPRNYPDFEWNEYSFIARRRFQMGSLKAALGLAYQMTDLDLSRDKWGPVFSISSSNLFGEDGPEETGYVLQGCGWWPEGEELNLRLNLTYSRGLAGDWWLSFNSGFHEGDIDDPVRSAYLGTQEELFSYARDPVRAETTAWAQLLFKRDLVSRWWGKLTADIFGGIGYAYDDNGDLIEDLWEIGLGFSAPGYFFDGRLLLIWNEDDEF